jgi:hypothetical protein
MSELLLCEGCQRHVKAGDSRCPFCEGAMHKPAAPRAALSMLFAVAAAATVAACYGSPRRAYTQPSPAQGDEQSPSNPTDSDGGTITQGSIGVARMLADRSIELQLRAEDGRGAVGEGLFRYGVEHPQYGQILAHVGPMSPGDQRPVAPF